MQSPIGEYNKICRTCLTETEDLRSLFREGIICGQITTLSLLLSNLIGIDIIKSDGLPEKVCLKCVLNISRAYTFIQQCTNSNTKLRDTIQNISAENSESTNKNEECNDYDLDTSSNFAIDEEETICNITQEEITNSKNDIQIDDQISTILYKDSDAQNIEFIDIQHCDENPPLGAAIVDDNDLTSAEITFRKLKTRSKKRKEESLTCNVCNKTLSNSSSFKYHQQLHSEESQFLCSDCGVSFKTRNAYDGHMITHVDENPHTCDICGKSYRQAASLRCHMLTHTGEKPFLCVICGKGCTQKSSLKKHMLIHNAEKSHQCTECGIKFRYLCNLVTHNRLHTGDKPFSCDVCEKRFSSKEQLKRHKIVHTTDKPFSCDICEKKFNRKSSLVTHKTTHSGKRKYSCKICGKSFIQLNCFNSHMNTHDAESNKT